MAHIPYSKVLKGTQCRKNGEKDDYVFLISNFEKEEAEEEEQGGDY